MSHKEYFSLIDHIPLLIAHRSANAKLKVLNIVVLHQIEELANKALYPYVHCIIKMGTDHIRINVKYRDLFEAATLTGVA